MHWAESFIQSSIGSLWDQSALYDYIKSLKKAKTANSKKNWARSVDANKKGFFFGKIFLISYKCLAAMGFHFFNIMTSKNQQVWTYIIKPRVFLENPLYQQR